MEGRMEGRIEGRYVGRKERIKRNERKAKTNLEKEVLAEDGMDNLYMEKPTNHQSTNQPTELFPIQPVGQLNN